MINLILRCPECNEITDRREITEEDVHDLFGPDVLKDTTEQPALLMVWTAAPTRRSSEYPFGSYHGQTTMFHSR